MDKRAIRIAAVVVGLLLLGSIANSIYHSGWSQGYFMGILASGENGSQLMAPYFMYGRHGFGGGFFGAIFRFGLFALFFAALFKGLRCLKAHRHEHWGGPSWSKHWHDDPQREAEAEPDASRDDDSESYNGGGKSGPTPTGRIYWA